MCFPTLETQSKSPCYLLHADCIVSKRHVFFIPSDTSLPILGGRQFFKGFPRKEAAMGQWLGYSLVHGQSYMSWTVVVGTRETTKMRSKVKPQGKKHILSFEAGERGVRKRQTFKFSNICREGEHQGL